MAVLKFREAAEEDRDELRQDCDDWRAHAERLLRPPAPIVTPSPPRRLWWRRFGAQRQS
jgi:hypothetical protein